MKGITESLSRSEFIERAKEVYGVDYWGEGHFSINSDGRVVVCATPNNLDEGIPLSEIVNAARQLGLDFPILFRFQAILHQRIEILSQAFCQSMEQESYQAQYSIVYPIKVNQQCRVVEEISGYKPSHECASVGLEAGSKPELMAALAMMPSAGGVIVCNGFKDREFIRLALMGERMGNRVFIVIEKLSELPLILDESDRLGVAPRLGVRIRLSTIGKGKWQNTGGEKAKFGLVPSQIQQLIDCLKQANRLNCLEMTHCMLGSQVSNIHDVTDCMREAARFMVEIWQQGAPITWMDVGGGLAIDYDGTRSRNYFSMNYSVEEYAHGIVRAIRLVCDEVGMSYPNIISESGRAITAHHAVLVSNIVDEEPKQITQKALKALIPPCSDATPELLELWQCLTDSKNTACWRSLQELYHDVCGCHQQLQAKFIHGLLSLEALAHAESIYLAACQMIRQGLSPAVRHHLNLIDELDEKLATKVFLNFSIFQSIPDVWGIDQIFPIMPLERLDRPLTKRVVIEDITCDSDGRIDDYVDSGSISATLPCPEGGGSELDTLAIFLVGAYQETLGDMHNLFGDTNAIDVIHSERGGFKLMHPQKGDTVETLLRYVNFDPTKLLEHLTHRLDVLNLSAENRRIFIQALRENLVGYCYLEDQK